MVHSLTTVAFPIHSDSGQSIKMDLPASFIILLEEGNECHQYATQNVLGKGL